MDAVFPEAFASRQNIEIEETIRKERPRLLNFIRTRVPTEDDAQDILQEVLGQLIEAYRGLETIDRVSSWLFRVARNKITDAYRRRKPEAGLQMLGAREHGSGMGLEDVPTPTEDPEALYMRETIWHAIEAALKELPRAQRQAFVLHELESMSFKDISELTGETENSLRLRKHHATRALRAKLASLYHGL